jgi:hypothetical protein
VASWGAIIHLFFPRFRLRETTGWTTGDVPDFCCTTDPSDANVIGGSSLEIFGIACGVWVRLVDWGLSYVSCTSLVRFFGFWLSVDFVHLGVALAGGSSASSSGSSSDVISITSAEMQVRFKEAVRDALGLCLVGLEESGDDMGTNSFLDLRERVFARSAIPKE